MNNWIWIVVLLCVLATLLVIYINYRKTKKTMDTIEKMLDTAIEGTYSETHFDEEPFIGTGNQICQLSFFLRDFCSECEGGEG